MLSKGGAYLHNTEGPAYILADESRFYINGIIYKELDYWIRIEDLKKDPTLHVDDKFHYMDSM